VPVPGFETFHNAWRESVSLVDAGYSKGVPNCPRLQPAKLESLGGCAQGSYRSELRYQIVKGWLDASGKLHEKIYGVAWSSKSSSNARITRYRHCRLELHPGRGRQQSSFLSVLPWATAD
jgi:hypothetical protein